MMQSFRLIALFLLVCILGTAEALANAKTAHFASNGPRVSAWEQDDSPIALVARNEKRSSLLRWKEIWGKLFVQRRPRSRQTKNAERESPRLKKELQSFLANPPPNCEIEKTSDIRKWTIRLMGVKGTVYSGEVYRLRLEFPVNYPSVPPKVYFLKPVPRHTHVYSNGDICLNVLGADWSPSMTAESLVVSILSMLSSAKEKGVPQDNSLHSAESPGKQQDNWIYHDDKC